MSAAPAARLILDEVDSTNEEARRRAMAGEPGPLWIMARRQTAGRGRRGRPWRGGGGDLHATCLLRPEVEPRRAALLSFAACLSVAETFDHFGPRLEPRLKWPNDVLLSGRKAAGVLLETGGSGRVVDWLAVGIGINLANVPEGLGPEAWPATSLAAETGRPPPSPEQALDVLAEAFARWSARLTAEGFAPLRDVFLARVARLGERIEARLPNETLTGIFADLDLDGALVLAQGNVARRVFAADLHFS